MKQIIIILAPFSAILALFSAAAPAWSQEMARIDGGTYVPLYNSEWADENTRIAPFYLSTVPVTNAEYLLFVQAHPEWRRSRVRRIFTDEGYLRHWASDLVPGDGAPANAPVVNVSWFAARAYAEWKGMRLPTTAEWEYAASAGIKQRDGLREKDFKERLLRLYSRANRGTPPAVRSTFKNYWGVYDLHGLVWEWVEDFNSNLVSGESRNDADLDRGLFCGGATLNAGSFADYPAFIRFALRSGLQADYAVSNLGFRLAASVSRDSAGGGGESVSGVRAGGSGVRAGGVRADGTRVRVDGVRADGTRVRADGVRVDGDAVWADHTRVRADGDGVRADGTRVRADAAIVGLLTGAMVAAHVPDEAVATLLAVAGRKSDRPLAWWTIGAHGPSAGVESGAQGPPAGVESGAHGSPAGVEFGAHGSPAGVEFGAHGATLQPPAFSPTYHT